MTEAETRAVEPPRQNFFELCERKQAFGFRAASELDRKVDDADPTALEERDRRYTVRRVGDFWSSPKPRLLLGSAIIAVDVARKRLANRRPQRFRVGITESSLLVGEVDVIVLSNDSHTGWVPRVSKRARRGESSG